MAEDRRTNLKLTQDDVCKLLNSKQLSTLHENATLGWRVDFIRRPLFLEPVIVLYNERFEVTGLLDLDGNIDMHAEINVRPGEHPKQQQAPTASSREKRKGTEPIPHNLDELLSPMQLSALREMEALGWKLHFVRRPDSKEPVAMITSPKGDRYAALNHDGLLRLMPDSAVRKYASIGQSDFVQLVSEAKRIQIK